MRIVGRYALRPGFSLYRIRRSTSNGAKIFTVLALSPDGSAGPDEHHFFACRSEIASASAMNASMRPSGDSIDVTISMARAMSPRRARLPATSDRALSRRSGGRDLAARTAPWTSPSHVRMSWSKLPRWSASSSGFISRLN